VNAVQNCSLSARNTRAAASPAPSRSGEWPDRKARPTAQLSPASQFALTVTCDRCSTRYDPAQATGNSYPQGAISLQPKTWGLASSRTSHSHPIPADKNRAAEVGGLPPRLQICGRQHRLQFGRDAANPRTEHRTGMVSICLIGALVELRGGNLILLRHEFLRLRALRICAVRA
jgi:hypothetical protein